MGFHIRARAEEYRNKERIPHSPKFSHILHIVMTMRISSHTTWRRLRYFSMKNVITGSFGGRVCFLLYSVVPVEALKVIFMLGSWRQCWIAPFNGGWYCQPGVYIRVWRWSHECEREIFYRWGKRAVWSSDVPGSIQVERIYVASRGPAGCAVEWQRVEVSSSWLNSPDRWIATLLVVRRRRHQILSSSW